MGLDYHYDFSPRDVQCVILERQLELAARLDLPVVIHARKAHEEIVRILTKHAFVGRKVVFHCYSGTPRQAAELRANGWRTSFTGILTFEKADDMRQVLMEAPADQLMFETDAPYLSPEPVRKIRPNEPKNLVHTLSFAAKLRGMALEDLARLSTSNAIQFFGLPLQRTGQ
jgi:TatD DNase family protein